MTFGPYRPSAVGVVLAAFLATLHGEPQLAPAVERPTAVLTRPTPMDPDDVAGIVIGLKGPEAGVWVIAETNDLPTKFVRIVASDEEGRYVLPDLPKAGYEVFARGYGLVDARRIKVWPGQQLFIGVMDARPDDAGYSDLVASRPQGVERNLVMTMWSWDGTAPPGPQPPFETGDIKALLPAVDLRVPYPKGSFSLNAQLRVDDATAGWKGRGVWSTFTLDDLDANRAERRLLKVQVRPDPLAR